MGSWRDLLPHDPLPALFAAGDPALLYWVRRDLLGEPVGPVEELWDLPAVSKLLRKQQADGSWRYAGQGPARFPYTNYALLESYRTLRVLVEMYGLDQRHPAVQRAAGYVFSRQTREGDIRGIVGNQYMPYYHGALLELLIKAGYGDEPRVERGLKWLLSVRQDDGGWIIPTQAVPPAEKTEKLWRGKPLPPERGRPSSHLATGMVLRALAAHPRYRHSAEARPAGRLLKARLLRPDKYNDRRAASYWCKFQFPFWWTDLLSALDSLSLLGFSADDADLHRGVAWFIAHQQEDGLWPTDYEKGRRAQATVPWVGLAICRVLQRLVK